MSCGDSYKLQYICDDVTQKISCLAQISLTFNKITVSYIMTLYNAYITIYNLVKI